jgi:MFS family permease
VAALFVLNAVAYANVVPRLPAIKADLDLSNTALGTAVAAMPVGALLSGPFAGRLVAVAGSGPLAVACAVGFGAVLPGFAVAPSWGALAGVFLVAGALDSLMDVAMNAHALRVQRVIGRSIINALHGMWSVGAVAGGLAATAAAGAGIGLGPHLAAAGASIVVVALAVRGRLLEGPEELERQPPGAEGGGGRSRRGSRRRLGLLGVVVLLSAMVEDAPQSWGAVYLRDDLGTSAAAAGLLYVAFQAAMTATRLVADRVIDRRGELAVVRGGGLLTAAGAGLGLALGTAPAAVAGFALAGVGTAVLFPVVFHAAGEVPGVSTGQGLAVVAWTGRVGFLVAAPLVGVLADAAGLRTGLLVVPAAGLAVAALARPAFGPGTPSDHRRRGRPRRR